MPIFPDSRRSGSSCAIECAAHRCVMGEGLLALSSRGIAGCGKFGARNRGHHFLTEFMAANDIFATLRNTISITSLKGSDKVNVIPPEASGRERAVAAALSA